jgi:hypothetical protein
MVSVLNARKDISSQKAHQASATPKMLHVRATIIWVIVKSALRPILSSMEDVSSLLLASTLFVTNTLTPTVHLACLEVTLMASDADALTLTASGSTIVPNAVVFAVLLLDLLELAAYDFSAFIILSLLLKCIISFLDLRYLFQGRMGYYIFNCRPLQGINAQTAKN